MFIGMLFIFFIFFVVWNEKCVFLLCESNYFELIIFLVYLGLVYFYLKFGLIFFLKKIFCFLIKVLYFLKFINIIFVCFIMSNYGFNFKFSGFMDLNKWIFGNIW